MVGLHSKELVESLRYYLPEDALLPFLRKVIYIWMIALIEPRRNEIRAGDR